MEDIYDTTIVCGQCHKTTEKAIISKDGFRIRAWHCVKCGKKWLHPADTKAYEDFLKIKQMQFNVKLRQVGNSWAISIPKEIIQFEAVKATKTVHVSLDEPNRVTISFTSISKIIKDESGGK